MRDIRTELKNKIDNIPALPGIYKMLDTRGNIIYVGKSKCLKNRVKSYFVKEHKWEKINRLVELIYDIDYMVTDTHLEARLLECELIKSIKPYFNSQMKNDQKYAYLQIKDYNPYNALAVVNERTENTYGPFRSRNILNDLINLLKNIYPVSFYGNRYNFEYHIFPVVMDKDTFNSNRKVLEDILNHEEKFSLFISQIEEEMYKAAGNYRYEVASLYRDMINHLRYIGHGINGYKELSSKRLILKIPTADGVKLFYVSNGKILLSKKYKRLTQLNKYLDDFIKKGDILSNDNNISSDDKSAIDYRDILYSEISSLPKEMIIMQN